MATRTDTELASAGPVQAGLPSQGAIPSPQHERRPSTNGHASAPVPAATAPPTDPAGGNLRHIAAVHSRLKTSCLSHDSGTTPSFLGFRNLMVLVLSEHLLSLEWAS